MEGIIPTLFVPRNRIWPVLNLFTQLSSGTLDVLLHILAVRSEGGAVSFICGLERNTGLKKKTIIRNVLIYKRQLYIFERELIL